MAYEIRPMSFGEILDTGFRLLRNHFGPLMSIAAVVYVPLTLFGQGLESYAAPGAAAPGADSLLSILGMVAGLLLLLFVGFPLMGAAMTFALGEAYLGRAPEAGVSLRRAWRIFLPLMGTQFLALLIMFGAGLFFIIPGIYFMLAYWLSSQVMVLEGTFGMAALRRSRDLMVGNKLRALGVMLVPTILSTVVDGGATWALGSLPWIQAVVSAVIQAAGIAYLLAVDVVFYFDIRCRKEAFDLEHLARLVEQRAADPAAPPAP
ncbi:MAG: hypothetical protein ACRERC_07680, partial [Candidatus Binatia bacterium]